MGRFLLLSFLAVAVMPAALLAQGSSSSSSSTKHGGKGGSASESSIDAGAVTKGEYRNRALGLSYKIPDGWVLRTEEMNAREDGDSVPQEDPHISQNQGDMGHPA